MRIYDMEYLRAFVMSLGFMWVYVLQAFVYDDAITWQIMEAQSQATVLNIIGKAPRNYFVNAISYWKYCDKIPIANI